MLVHSCHAGLPDSNTCIHSLLWQVHTEQVVCHSKYMHQHMGCSLGRSHLQSHGCVLAFLNWCCHAGHHFLHKNCSAAGDAEARSVQSSVETEPEWPDSTWHLHFLFFVCSAALTECSQHFKVHSHMMLEILQPEIPNRLMTSKT